MPITSPWSFKGTTGITGVDRGIGLNKIDALGNANSVAGTFEGADNS